MKQPNTKRHWTALAVARFYEEHETAARARDLYPLLEDIFPNPDTLVAALFALNEQDVIDHMVITSPSKRGSSKVFAYYPTNITIEELRDLEEPTELPDGTPISGDMDVHIPTMRVASGELPDKPQAKDEEVGLDYANVASGGDGDRDYDSSQRSVDPDAALEVTTDGGGTTDQTMTDDTDDTDDAADTDDEHTCPYCGDSYDSGNALGGHKNWCDERPAGVGHDRDDADDQADDTDELPDVEITEFDDSDSIDTADIGQPNTLSDVGVERRTLQRIAGERLYKLVAEDVLERLLEADLRVSGDYQPNSVVVLAEQAGFHDDIVDDAHDRAQSTVTSPADEQSHG
jgi:hypothetical protein